MSDYTKAFAISASGMTLERLRLEVASMNIANSRTTGKTSTGQPYHPLRVVAHAQAQKSSFENRLNGSAPAALAGVGDIEVVEVQAPPRLEHDPGHPDADAQGLVALPQINPAEEMITVMTAVRSYEANVRAMNAAKTMALKALEIGGAK